MEYPDYYEGKAVKHRPVIIIPLSEIRIGEKNPSRKQTKKINRHVEWLEEHPDQDLWPIDVVYNPETGSYQVLGNGRHRVLAYREAGHHTIPAFLHSSGDLSEVGSSSESEKEQDTDAFTPLGYGEQGTVALPQVDAA